MNWFILIGIVIIVIGFSLKLDTFAVLIVAALTTALVAGIPLDTSISTLGEYFVKNRAVTIFLVPIPMIALIERFGLKQQATSLMSKLGGLTAPIILFCYTIIREVALFFAMPIGGHVQFIRPLIYPMTEAAAGRERALDAKDVDKIKAKSAASENIANFFSQNTYAGSAAILLIIETLKNAGYEVAAKEISQVALIIAGMSILVVGIDMFLWNIQLKKGGRN